MDFCKRIAEKPECESCRSINAEDNTKPPCKKCLPYLMPENHIIYMVYSKVSGQHIIGPTGAIALRLEPIFKVMDLMNIHKNDQLYCIDLIQKMDHTMKDVYKDKKP